MTTITVTSSLNPLIATLPFAWQATRGTQETLPTQASIYTIANAWQLTQGSLMTVPTQELINYAQTVRAPVIGVRHRSQDNMGNYTVTPQPYKGPTK